MSTIEFYAIFFIIVLIFKKWGKKLWKEPINQKIEEEKEHMVFLKECQLLVEEMFWKGEGEKVEKDWLSKNGENIFSEESWTF